MPPSSQPSHPSSTGHPDLAERFTAQTPEQARLLLDFTLFRPLAILIQGDASASDVARRSQQPLKTAHHKLQRLQRAGLIHQVGQRPRPGRPIKLYRALAQEYRVPFHLTSAATIREWLINLQAPFLQAHQQQAAQSLALSDTREAILRLSGDEFAISLDSPDRSDDPSEGLSVFTQVRLSSQDRQELLRRLKELREWMTARHTTNEATEAQPCLLGLLLTSGPIEGL